MGGVVDATAFDHQEEPLWGRAQAPQGDLGHLGERGRRGLECGRVQAVDLIGQMALAEKAQQRGLAGVGQELVAVEGEAVAGLTVSGLEVGVEILRTAAEDDIDAALEILGGDGLLVGALADGRGEAGRRRVRGGGGGDEAASFLGGVHLLDQSERLAAVLSDVQHAVVDALADAPAAGGGGGVGHDAAGGVGLAERADDRAFGIHLHPMRRTLLRAGEVGLRGGEHREAHAVRDHEDDVLGLALGGVGGGLAAVGAEGPGRAGAEDEAAETGELQEVTTRGGTGLAHGSGIGSKDPAGQPQFPGESVKTS